MCGMIVALQYARSFGVVVLQDALQHPAYSQRARQSGPLIIEAAIIRFHRHRELGLQLKTWAICLSPGRGPKAIG